MRTIEREENLISIWAVTLERTLRKERNNTNCRRKESKLYGGKKEGRKECGNEVR